MEGAMAATINTSIRMGEDVRDMYETIARATGRTRNDLMAEALRVEGERQLREIALIEEGLDDLRAGRSATLDEVVARLRERRMLPLYFALGEEEEGAATGA
jgi:predicted transcriptional regulator